PRFVPQLLGQGDGSFLVAGLLGDFLGRRAGQEFLNHQRRVRLDLCKAFVVEHGLLTVKAMAHASDLLRAGFLVDGVCPDAGLVLFGLAGVGAQARRILDASGQERIELGRLLLAHGVVAGEARDGLAQERSVFVAIFLVAVFLFAAFVGGWLCVRRR